MLATVAGAPPVRAPSRCCRSMRAKHGLIVVVASDRGLAGGFNTTVERTAEKLAASRANRASSARSSRAGKKATVLHVPHKAVMHFEGNSSEPDFDEAHRSPPT